ncbi:phosphoribosylamine--glycine ligase [Pediococcus pentosaceus]|jgi:phosphoribosylamine--glycine ligase|uniref:phosphoribosylamine--glycine ligase n=1 Tax=Pediococcus pentosaceus TaxID=1255 RepID=UPI00076252AF|nr:phosphoribosylamine--glycine ligase [Pediococcus pentosaceus]MBF7109380.1 phosphoribosylamine--glycine ligase [Pediococcus pentosaceus]MBF7120795.1 phosphoribosylamine--glycine ligase [Pediococcus pentosaceus]MBU7002751.1 phosphoribosylamine--glycine ligase [Pediococcus pentosaceus]MCG9227311.1 phosphoribosylamine--glycine ligase [Pediococcus pentosaceus]MCQ9196077.1 phosphoribosylamine--glycine ligase [Pediococcus pentosaceus]
MAKVLVIGNGAREHVLGRQLLKSSQVEKVYCAPGNPGMLESGIEIIPIGVSDFEGLVEFAQKQGIDLTIVGPEQPLQQGIVDYFSTAGLTIFGPTQAAAKLESSKEFAKKIMQEAGVPTASYVSYQDEATAIKGLAKNSYPLVIKSDGLAAGKGVVIAKNQEEATTTIHKMLGEHQFDSKSIIIEEFLTGQEFSLMAFIQDEQIIPMPLSQDHKAAYDGDEGPNTGGMGAYSPLQQFPSDLVNEGVEKIIRPIIRTLKKKNITFCGILYAGLIMTDSGPKVIEFNVRLGDPETVVVLPQLQSDLYEMLQGLLHHQVPVVKWQKDQVYLGVVISSQTYPQASARGVELADFNYLPSNITVNYAGVSCNQNGQLISNGGRILCLTTRAGNITKAQAILYGWLNQHPIPSLRYRSDIGDKAK